MAIFQVRIEMGKHEASGLRSLPPDLPGLQQRLGVLTQCLLILDVCPFRYTGPGV